MSGGGPACLTNAGYNSCHSCIDGRSRSTASLSLAPKIASSDGEMSTAEWSKWGATRGLPVMRSSAAAGALVGRTRAGPERWLM